VMIRGHGRGEEGASVLQRCSRGGMGEAKRRLVCWRDVEEGASVLEKRRSGECAGEVKERRERRGRG